jgi:signal transduction histidine kinase
MGTWGTPQRHADLVLAAVLAAVMTTEIARWEPADLVRAIPAGLLATLPLALRRKTPLVCFLLVWIGMVGVIVFGNGIDNDSIAFIVVFFIALYSLGRHASGPEMWLGLLAVLTNIILFAIFDGDEIDAGGVAFAVGFVGGPWAAGVAIRLYRDRERAVADKNLALERDQAEHARRAVAAERSRIARELHDVVSHAIAVTVLQARGGRKMLGVDEHAVRRSLDAIEHTNAQALGDMRRLLSVLRDTEGDGPDSPQPSLARLDSLLEQVRESGLPVELSVTGNGHDVPPGVDLSAYRIIQEALTNVLKHAGPRTTTQVKVGYGDEDLDISVLDNGVTPANGDGRGNGLIGIRERVAVVGGEVEAGPAPGGGFFVHARLPYAVDA